MTEFPDNWQNSHHSSESFSERQRAITDEVNELLTINEDPHEFFTAFVKRLQDDYEIDRSMLALRDGPQLEFVAVATFGKNRTRKKLSLRVPAMPSLFAKVAEDGRMYMESFTHFFDGNSIERNLMLTDSTQSFLLKPLKHDTEVVALIGLSSELPDAFVTLEEGLLDPAFELIGEYLSRHSQS